MPEEVQPVVEPELTSFDITLSDGRKVYLSSEEEFNDCFYAVLALLSWSKTFAPKPDLSLTFSTITDEDRQTLLGNVRAWAEKNNASSQMFEAYMTKVNLAYYLTVIKIQGSLVNLREQPIEKRLEYLSTMPEQAINFYGMYNFIFNEIVRRALIEPLTLKNS